MSLREWYLRRRVVRLGRAAARADDAAARSTERLRNAIRAFAELKTPPQASAPLKRLWPAGRDRAAEYREVQLKG